MNLNRKERTIWQALLGAGYDTYIVGGAVRDYLLGEDPKDIDFATHATPAQINQVFKDSEFKLDFVGASFGVMLISGVEVATFRGDRYFGGGDKDVEITYVDTIEEDLARRDLTINAIAYDSSGNIVDPFGGRADLEKGIIRFVGDAEDRINEDPNRIFRALRFTARFDFELADDTWDAITVAVDEGIIDGIAPERIRLEILKTLESTKKASVFWELLFASNILDYIFPELQKVLDTITGITTMRMYGLIICLLVTSLELLLPWRS